ncbi:hypothetical protein IW262DRAFT_1296041 [Armillaria fumosa]|nr:hypothetical protein IW262DRAFT_1296041 [Armillaria fumosa]
MSTESLPLQNISKANLKGYSAAKHSSLVWSLPVLCRQFLLMPLDPKKWFKMHAVTSDQDTEILEFGKAIGRTLKFVADESWSKGDLPKESIDSIFPVRGTHRSANHLDTLVLVKAMDIATGCQYLRRLDDWPGKLEQIQTSFRMYTEQTSIPLPAIMLGRNEGKVILHNDVCLLANHWKHESVKSWLKALCILDALWSGTDVTVEKYPDVQMIMANDDMLKKFKENLPRWKQVFANAVAILPLVLILGKGISQMLNMPQALQVRGQLSSLGKPDSLLQVKELLWRCIIGIAWGSWTSDVEMKRFLDQVQPLLTKIQLTDKEMKKERLG